MSAFLGPIHHWLYGKIRLQERLIGRIAEAATQNRWGAGEKNPSGYVNGESRPLDELIDTTNIHGWLQERIRDVETRYASLVAGVLKEDPSRVAGVKRIVAGFGAEQALPAESSASQIYEKFEDVLLNGMPCDRVNVVTSRDEDAFAWEQTQDLHGAYRQAAGTVPQLYYELRDCLMNGMIAATAYALRGEDHVHYELAKKTA